MTISIRLSGNPCVVCSLYTTHRNLIAGGLHVVTLKIGHKTSSQHSHQQLGVPPGGHAWRVESSPDRAKSARFRSSEIRRYARRPVGRGGGGGGSNDPPPPRTTHYSNTPPPTHTHTPPHLTRSPFGPPTTPPRKAGYGPAFGIGYKSGNGPDLNN